METYYAPAERADNQKLNEDIDFANKNPIINGLLNLVGGLLTVVNEERQIVTLNDMLLKTMGVSNPGAILGLRLGEALRCTHAHDMPGGCGTGEFCISCGAAIAQVACMNQDQPVEKYCALTTEKDGVSEDLFLNIRACPVTYDTRKFLLLFIQDITKEQKLAALERVFFHDISNIISGLLNASELISLQSGPAPQELIDYIHTFSTRLANEVAMQRCLAQSEGCDYQCTFKQVSLRKVIKDLKHLFTYHPAATNKSLKVPNTIADLTVNTDVSLLMRVLSNMVINAFEETAPGDPVKLSVTIDEAAVTFGVWNKKAIPKKIKKRIFQRNISTKPEMGRGLGTYSMKLFGETVLGGHVDFTSSEDHGTLFQFRLNR